MAHAIRPKTLCAHYALATGLAVQEETWADKISFGQLTLVDVPVRESNMSQKVSGSQDYYAVFGLAALKRLNLIVDGKRGMAYLEAKKTPSTQYPHNRIGAVFAPVDIEKTDDLLAHVLDGSPAFEAGIRNGDLLLRVDNRDVTRWRTDPAIPINRAFEQTNGTKINLTLKRGEKEYRTTVLLRDLIGPKSAAESVN